MKIEEKLRRKAKKFIQKLGLDELTPYDTYIVRGTLFLEFFWKESFTALDRNYSYPKYTQYSLSMGVLVSVNLNRHEGICLLKTIGGKGAWDRENCPRLKQILSRYNK